MEAFHDADQQGGGFGNAFAVNQNAKRRFGVTEAFSGVVGDGFDESDGAGAFWWAGGASS